MNPILRISITLLAWGLFFGYWLIAARSAKRVASSEPPASRILHLSLWIGGFVLAVFPEILPLGRILPDTLAVYLTGLAVVLSGHLFGVWARSTLGAYWSGSVAIKAEHKLIRAGPYALVRHPIYTGIIAAFLGTALSTGQLSALIGFALVTAAYVRKVYIEEAWLVGQFGAEYADYRHAVKTLIPFIL
jgi:protein-S-isoprenylcysteine O-methyltransferase Ste14